MDDELITMGQAAAEFEIPRMKLYRWAKEGRLVAYKSGRDERVRLVRRADVAALLQPEPVRAKEDPHTKRAA